MFVGLSSVYAQSKIVPGYFGASVQYPTPQYQQYKFDSFVHNQVVPAAPRYVVGPSPSAAYVTSSPPTYVAPQVRSGVADKDAHIVAEAREVNFDGNFNYGYIFLLQ